MNIVSSGNSMSGRWQFIDDERAVYISMDNWQSKDFKMLGVLENDTLVSTNETGLGTIVVTYVKDPNPGE